MADVDEKEKLLKKVKAIVRSLLISSKGGVVKQRLLADYRSFIGSPMPLRELGYRSLDHFVYDNSDLIREGISSTGVEVYTGIADASTAHVARMVASQKKPSLKKAKKNFQRTPFGQSYGAFRPRVPPSRFKKYPSWQPSRGFNKAYQQSSSQYRQYPFKPASRPDQYNSYGQHSRVPGPPHSLVGQPVNRHVPVATASFNPSTSTFSSTSLWSYKSKTSQQIDRPFNYQTSSAPSLRVKKYGSIPPWKESFRDAIHVGSVGELLQSEDKYHGKMIVLTGYPGGRDKINASSTDYYRLLFFHGYNPQNAPQNRLNPPAINIFFQPPDWDIKVHADPEQLVDGTQVRIYGWVEYKIWPHRQKHYHSVKVVYYEKRIGSQLHSQESYRVEGLGNIPIRVTASGTGPTRSRQVIIQDSNKKQEEDHSSSLSGSSEPSPTDVEQWLRKTLEGKTNGVWGKVLLTKYSSYFHRKAPSGFLETISTFPYISVESVTEDALIVYLVDKPPSSPPALPALPAPSLPVSVEIPSTGDELMNVLVVLANSPTEFFIHLVGEEYSEALETLHDEMLSHFENSNAPGPTLSDKLCAHCMDVSGEKQWTRALVESTSKNRKDAVLIYYPDYGNIEEVDVKELRKLPQRFWKLPFQAVQCVLHGFEDASPDSGKKFVELAFEKQFFAKVIERNDDVYTVELITSDNQDLLAQLLDAVRPTNTLQPQLPEAGSGDRVAVTLVDIDIQKEEVSVQVAGIGTRRLADLVVLLNDTYSTKNSARDRVKRSVLAEGTMCCCKFTDDDSWYRARVISFTGDKVSVEYVDYGNTEVVDIAKLRKPLNHDLFNLPPQAVRCRLHGIPPKGGQWTELAVHFLLEYLDCEGVQLEVMSDGAVVLLYDEEDINRLMLGDPALFSSQTATPEESSMEGASLSGFSGLSIHDSETKRSANSDEAVDSSQRAVSKDHLSLEQHLASPRPLAIHVPTSQTSGAQSHRTHAGTLDLQSPGSNAPFTTQESQTPQAPHTPQGPHTPPAPSDPHTTYSTQTPPGPRIEGPQTPPTNISIRGPQTPPMPSSNTSFQVSLKFKYSLPTISTENYKFEELTVNKPTPVTVAYAASPGDFTVHLKTNTDTLAELNRRLHRYCCTASSSQSEFPATTCCAALNSDGRWYRGTVMESPQLVTSTGKVYVCFTDYGDCELVNYHDLRVLPVEFHDLPFQGIKCQLSGVTSTQEREWGSEVCYIFERLVSGVQLIALANSTTSGSCSIRLMDLAKNIVINDYLVSLGLVTKTT